MNVKQVVDGFSVTEQIEADDVTRLADEGFKTIICNRPDGEAEGQPTAAEIQAGAEKSGLDFREVPVVSGQLTPADIAAMSAALEELPRPMLAYCRTGTRSIQLWALAEGIHGMPHEEILAAGERAGYDLAPVVRWLEKNS